jgi:hypothetical protein
MAETIVETQVRLVLERQCRAAADLLAKEIPAGTVFCLVLADVGSKGNLAYVSSCERESAANLLDELLGKWRREHSWAAKPSDYPCCHSCLAPGIDTDRALVVAFVSGLAAKEAGLRSEPMSRMLCEKHARIAGEAAAFLMSRVGTEA